MPLIRRENSLPDGEIKSYRIIQLMFDITLILLLGITFGWLPFFCGGLLKFFALQDLLYYVFLKKELPKSWTRLRWTPLGLIKKKLSRLEVVPPSAGWE